MEFRGLKNPNTSQSEFNAVSFAIQQALNQVQTVTLVRIIAVTNAGGIEPVGFVDVQPMVNLMTADRVGIEHGVIYGLPYFRLQGGQNAIIIDPQVGDIGMCCFASRDISAVIKSRKPNNQGSFRKFDWADGLYIGGMLNGTPNQIVRFSATGIEITSPNKVTINAPDITLNASETYAWNVNGYGERLTHTGGANFQLDSYKDGATVNTTEHGYSPPQIP